MGGAAASSARFVETPTLLRVCCKGISDLRDEHLQSRISDHVCMHFSRNFVEMKIFVKMSYVQASHVASSQSPHTARSQHRKPRLRSQASFARDASKHRARTPPSLSEAALFRILRVYPPGVHPRQIRGQV